MMALIMGFYFCTVPGLGFNRRMIIYKELEIIPLFFVIVGMTSAAEDFMTTDFYFIIEMSDIFHICLNHYI